MDGSGHRTVQPDTATGHQILERAIRHARVSTTTTAGDDQETPQLCYRAPDKMIMHGSVGIMPGGYVGLRFDWDSPG
jgi:hypothetical protein